MPSAKQERKYQKQKEKKALRSSWQGDRDNTGTAPEPTTAVGERSSVAPEWLTNT